MTQKSVASPTNWNIEEKHHSQYENDIDLSILLSLAYQYLPVQNQ